MSRLTLLLALSACALRSDLEPPEAPPTDGVTDASPTPEGDAHPMDGESTRDASPDEDTLTIVTPLEGRVAVPAPPPEPKPTPEAEPSSHLGTLGGGVAAEDASYGRGAPTAQSRPSPRPSPGQTVVRRAQHGPTGVTARPSPHHRGAHLPPAASSEGFIDYGTSGFALAAEEHLSTFALDVDNASYTFSRRRLREGRLPDPANIRVEEWVNFFPYHYRQPQGDSPLAVDVEVAPSPWTAPHHLVRIGVQSRHVAPEDLKPVRVTFLVDTSGSMRGPDRIELAKQSMRFVVDQLDELDTVSIATYAGTSRVSLMPTRADQKDVIHQAIDELVASGSTAMQEGIHMAYQMAAQAYEPGAVNRVIVLSDGDANIGNTSPDHIVREIRRYADQGITLTTIGFGTGNYQDAMMERLANQGDGNYYYIDGVHEARRIFVDRLASTLEVVARDVKLQVEFDPAQVLGWRLVGYENRHLENEQFRDDTADAGEVGSGHQVTALYEVILREGADPTALGTVRVRHKPPGPDAPAVEQAHNLGDTRFRERIEDASSSFRIAVAAATLAELLKGSAFVEEVSLAEVHALARSAQRRDVPEDAELLELIRRAAQLRGEQVSGR